MIVIQIQALGYLFYTETKDLEEEKIFADFADHSSTKYISQKINLK